MKRIFGPRKTKPNAPSPRIERSLKRYSEAAAHLEKICTGYNGKISNLTTELQKASSLVRSAKGAVELRPTKERPLWEDNLIVNYDTGAMHKNLEILEARLDYLGLMKERIREAHSENHESIHRHYNRLDLLHKVITNGRHPLSAKEMAKSTIIAGSLGAVAGFALLTKIIHSPAWAVLVGGLAAMTCVSFNFITSKLKQSSKVREIKEHERKAEWYSQRLDVRYPTLSNNVENALRRCREGVDGLVEHLLSDGITAEPKLSHQIYESIRETEH